MKQQILVIHGGDAFEKYEDYIKFLESFELTEERLRKKGWKDNLQKELGENYEIIAPRMPNPLNARYREWEIWFKKIIPFIDDGVILVGHSLGGIFLTKYFSENNSPKKIKAVFLVAAPYNTPENHPYVDFNVTKPLDNLSKQAGKIYLYHSKDDLIVPFENFERYQKDLPEAETRVFTDRGHFNEENFDEIIKDIKLTATD